MVFLNNVQYLIAGGGEIKLYCLLNTKINTV